MAAVGCAVLGVGDDRAWDHVGQEVVAAVGRAVMGRLIVDGGVIADELWRRLFSAIEISCNFLVVDT